MIPLRDRVLVKMDASLSRIVHMPTNVDKWHEARDQISNRGEVIAVGGGRRHGKTAVILANYAKVGNFVRFSELKYPSFSKDGIRYVLICDADIVGVEHG